jgi:hypothetical protein
MKLLEKLAYIIIGMLIAAVLLVGVLYIGGMNDRITKVANAHDALVRALTGPVSQPAPRAPQQAMAGSAVPAAVPEPPQKSK